jgi:BirA family transcriptional regulator, biotin operon repressor / biotin---[acetyl-CoA-carboxylase] ligase
MFYKNFTIKNFNQVESTNSLAWELAKSHQIDHNQIILANSQTGGKGRMGRSWASPSGNLYFSLLLKPQKPIVTSSQLSFVAAVSMGLAIAEFSQNDAQINYKWPNDILISGKKIAGILLQSDEGFVVLGVGVNINSHPKNTNYPATNLQDEGVVVKNKEALLNKFLDNFADLYQKWQDFGFEPIRNLWLKQAFNLNKEITANLVGESLKGIFKDLDKNGNLVLEYQKQVKIISSAEIF